MPLESGAWQPERLLHGHTLAVGRLFVISLLAVSTPLTASMEGQMRQATLCLIAAAAMATFFSPQDIRTATLVGTVTDGSGAVIPNVVVTVTNVDTQVVTRSLTKGEGSYYLPFLNVGNYRLTMEAPGFKRYEQSGLDLERRRESPCGRHSGSRRGRRHDQGDGVGAAAGDGFGGSWKYRERQGHTRYADPAIQAAALHVLPGRARRRTTTARITFWASPSHR